MSTSAPPQAPRPLVGATARPASFRLAATCFLAYVFYTNFGLWSDNEQIRYALTKAIVEDRSFRVDRYRQFLGLDKALHGGHLYCDKPPGSSFLCIPQYLLARTAAPQRWLGGRAERVRAWLVICLSVCLYAALSVAALYEVLGLMGVKRGRIGYCYAYALGTLAFPYATVMVGEQFAAPLVILAVWLALKGEGGSHLFWLGTAVGLTFVTCYHALLLVGWLIPLKWLTLKSKRQIVWAIAPALLMLALWLAYNCVCFGGPLNVSYAYWAGGARFHLGLPSLRQVHWATFSSWKGLFYYSPWLLFYFVGLVYMWRTQRLCAAYLALAAAGFMGFMLLSNQPDGHKWWVGDDFGARKFVPAIPIFAIGAAVGINTLMQRAKTALARRAVLAAAACAVAWGVFANSLGAMTSPVTYELTCEHGAYYVQRHPHEPKVKLEHVTNPLLDITLKGLLAFGSNNLVTQLWSEADVSAHPSAGQWALNMASNGIPIALALLMWYGPIRDRWRLFRQTRRGPPASALEPVGSQAGGAHIALWLLVAYLLVRLWLFAAYCTTVVAYPFEVCAAEGILLNQGRLLAHGASVYPPIGGYPFLISHFPPVLPLVLAAGVKLFGIAFWPGRLIAFGSAVAIACAVYLLASEWGRAKAPGLAAALLLATSPWFALSSVQVCPDTLALALSLAGVCLLARRQGSARAASAGVLLALAVLTRQTQVAGLVAVCWWLWRVNRRACWQVAVVWLAVVGLGAAAAEIASAGEFHRHVVTGTAGQLSLARLWLFIRAYARAHFALVALGACFVWGQCRRRELGLLGRYLLTAYVVAATCARHGSGQIYFIEAIALSCAAGGVVLARLCAHAGRRPWHVGIAVALAAALLEEARHLPEWPTTPTAAQRRESTALLHKLKALGPPILSEYNGLVLQAGGELLFQPYAFKMRWAKGRWDDQGLANDVRRAKFNAVVVDTVNRGRWTPAVYKALESAYGVEGEYWLYRHIGPTRVQLLLRRAGASAP